MGIKFDPVTQTWTAFFSKRHPITRLPKSLKRINLKTERKAESVERELILQIEKSFALEQKPQIKWFALAMTYMDAKRDADEWTEKTFENCRRCLEAHTFQVWKDREADSILPDEIRKLLKDRVGQKSPSHQQTLLKFIRGAFQFGVEQRLLSSNPTPKMHFEIGDKIKGVLTLEQVRIFLNQARSIDSEWYYHWAMAVYTGMRNGELYALTWEKVDFENRTILVDSSWNNKDGFKDTKSGDDRLLEIAPNLLTLLKELKLKTGGSDFKPGHFHQFSADRCTTSNNFDAASRR